MEYSKKRFLPLIPLIFWVILWFAVTVAAVYGYAQTHPENPDAKLWLIALVELIAFFDIAWYLMTCTKQNETGAGNKIANWLILDFPAVWMINKWFRTKAKEDAAYNSKTHVYVKGSDVPEDANDKEEEEWDVNLADWEKEILKKKHPDKYNKYVKHEEKENIIDYKVEEERKIIRGFSVYALYLIYKQDPEIVNTYKIISQYKDMMINDNKRKQMIKDFVKMPALETFIQDYDHKTMTSKAISDVLLATVPAEFEVALKQDRVQMQIDAKDNWFDREKAKTIKKPKAISTKKKTTKMNNKKSTD